LFRSADRTGGPGPIAGDVRQCDRGHSGEHAVLVRVEPCLSPIFDSIGPAGSRLSIVSAVRRGHEVASVHCGPRVWPLPHPRITVYTLYREACKGLKISISWAIF